MYVVPPVDVSCSRLYYRTGHAFMKSFVVVVVVVVGYLLTDMFYSGVYTFSQIFTLKLSHSPCDSSVCK